jgi:hypothetical protein
VKTVTLSWKPFGTLPKLLHPLQWLLRLTEAKCMLYICALFLWRHLWCRQAVPTPNKSSVILNCCLKLWRDHLSCGLLPWFLVALFYLLPVV